MPVHEQRQLHFVQHLELEQIQAVTVNGANMEIGEMEIGETDRRAQLLLAARVDALLQFSGGLLREGKCNDVAGLAAGAAASDGPQQGHHALRNDFGLAGSGAGDQLQIAADVSDRVLLSTSESRTDRIFARGHAGMIPLERPVTRELCRRTRNWCIAVFSIRNAALG